MTTAIAPVTPLVSMIVPVYNSVSYLAETLDSLLVQGLSDSELEVVIVDDGSNDGSETMADEYAERHPNFRVIHQEQSGGPASPCNEGVWAARGKYFFLLGADDVMTPNALRELADVAEREGSDVVLAKLGSLGGRRTPGSVYKKTVYDADLVEHKIFNTLAAVKLFRRDLVERTGAFHPPHLRVGSDQPFVAALFLEASKLSICADREYVLIRKRDDGTNITGTFRSPIEYVDLSSAVLAAIVKGTEPGPLRDGVVRRTFRREIPQIVGAAFLDLTEEEQRLQIERVREMLAPVYNEATAVHLDPRTRRKIELAIDGDLEILQEVIAWEVANPGAKAVHDGTGFVDAFPASLAERIGERRLHPPVVKGEAKLTGVSATGSVVEIGVTALALGSRTVPTGTQLRLIHRTTQDVVEAPTEVVRELVHKSGSGHEVRARVDLSGRSPGVWDAYAVQRFGEDEVVTRFGADKVGSVGTEPIYLFAEGEDPQAIGKLYYTRGPGNLSIDLGFTLTKNELPAATARGVVALRDGGELAIISVLSSGTFEVLAPSGDGSGRAIVPRTVLEGSLVAVELPRTVPDHGVSRHLIVRSGDAERTIPLPSAVPATDSAGASRTRAEDARVAREGERTLDILRGAVGGLGTVGLRSTRRVRREGAALARRLRGHEKR